MSLLTSTTIILDHMPYEPLAKTFFLQWRTNWYSTAGFFLPLPLENVHVTWTHAVSHIGPL
jgi:hypothetical protein